MVCNSDSYYWNFKAIYAFVRVSTFSWCISASLDTASHWNSHRKHASSTAGTQVWDSKFGTLRSGVLNWMSPHTAINHQVTHCKVPSSIYNHQHILLQAVTAPAVSSVFCTSCLNLLMGMIFGMGTRLSAWWSISVIMHQKHVMERISRILHTLLQ